MPLHLFLGLVTQGLDILEGLCKKFDSIVRQINGYENDEIEALYEVLEKMSEQIEEKDLKIVELEEQIKAKETEKNLATCHKTKLFIRKKIKMLQVEINDIERSKKPLLTKHKQIETEIGKYPHHFKKLLENILQKMKVNRLSYFSRSLNGNEVKKILCKKNIKELSKVLHPLKVHNNFIGGYNYSEEIYQLFNKLMQCYDLVSVTRQLCPHEIQHLKLRCNSLGNWFPKTFPNENLKFKFHILVHHAPDKAIKLGSCGLESEQGLNYFCMFFCLILINWIVIRILIGVFLAQHQNT